MLRLARHLTRRVIALHHDPALHDVLATLRWVDHMLGCRSGVRTWSAARRLLVTWSHADQVYRCCQRAGVAPGQLYQWLSPTGAVSPELFDRDQQYHADNAHPARVQPVSFVLDSLAYALAPYLGAVMTQALQMQMTDLAFPQVDDQPVPDLLLLDTGATRPGQLPTFLGGDRSRTLAHLLLDDSAAALAPAAYLAQVTSALDRLTTTPEAEDAWLVVAAVLGDRAPDEPIREHLTTVVRGTDLAAVVQRVPTVGRLAVRVICQHARSLPADIHGQVRTALVAIAQQHATPSYRAAGDTISDTAGDGDSRATLLQAAQHLALSGASVAEVLDQFVSIVIDLCTVWPAFARWCRPIIERVWDEVPPDQAARLAQLVLYLRACV